MVHRIHLHWTHLLPNRDHGAMTRTQHQTQGILTRARREVASVRAARAQHRALRRDLAEYTTDAEITDLLASLDGREDAGADAIRSIVLGNRAGTSQAA